MYASAPSRANMTLSTGSLLVFFSWGGGPFSWVSYITSIVISSYKSLEFGTEFRILLESAKKGGIITTGEGARLCSDGLSRKSAVTPDLLVRFRKRELEWERESHNSVVFTLLAPAIGGACKQSAELRYRQVVHREVWSGVERSNCVLIPISGVGV